MPNKRVEKFMKKSGLHERREDEPFVDWVNSLYEVMTLTDKRQSDVLRWVNLTRLGQISVKELAELCVYSDEF